jgi:signal peptidase I
MHRTWKEVAILSGAALMAVLIYLANPFHTATWDPRIRLYGVAPFRMPSSSMEPTIPENSIFLVTGWPYLLAQPRVGDVIAFKYPRDPSVAYTKRIIATGGSTVEINDGVVVVDGRPLSEGYIPESENLSAYSRSMPRIRVPPGFYFVLGDNRDNSADSRSWGFLPSHNVIGRVGAILITPR